ncbi:hypothetical protein BS47DRAFT_405890 [Hydnum rufescens UP504]|uniref:Protein phosphatase 1 regulatory subunit 7 n=1 Tax=Hydnum rufescens UP504 TaxID=1448309 RepID=A0A9P6BB45_9AGAM|nr:hypothetical protein BS47DRAFT_405890 [Hydnum rufescens UP504]
MSEVESLPQPEADVAPANEIVDGDPQDSAPRPVEPTKKRAVLVYEGDERWQPPKIPQPSPEQLSDADEDEGEEESPEEHQQAEQGDLLANYPDDTEIELLHSRISSVPSLRLPRFARSLKSLCLRQNSLAELDPAEFGPLTLLEELDIYDNQVKDLGKALENMTKLRSLDVSFNLLRAIPEVISCLSSLEVVYFIQNKITEISSLEGVPTTLKSLELGGNRIRTIENIDALVNLEELWLGKNKIGKLENLSSLKKLRVLSIQSNRITKLEGLESLTNLEDLYLSHNGIERIEGLENNLKLKTIDLGNNQISELENISHLTSLTELWINDNKIPNLRALTPQLGHIFTLNTIYLEGNPCQTNDRAGYRRKVILSLPHVSQVDATYVRS